MKSVKCNSYSLVRVLDLNRLMCTIPIPLTDRGKKHHHSKTNYIQIHSFTISSVYKTNGEFRIFRFKSGRIHDRPSCLIVLQPLLVGFARIEFWLSKIVFFFKNGQNFSFFHPNHRGNQHESTKIVRFSCQKHR